MRDKRIHRPEEVIEEVILRPYEECGEAELMHAELMKQCSEVIAECSGSSDVYDAVFKTIAGPDSAEMHEYKTAAEKLQNRLLNIAQEKESGEGLECKQSETDLARLYKEAVSVKEPAQNVITVLCKEAEQGLASIVLDMGPLKKMRCVLQASLLLARSPPLITVSCVCVAAVAHVRRLSCSPRVIVLGLSESVTLCV